MDLVQYLKRVVRWWWLFLICTGLAAGASYYVTSQQPRTYETTTTLLVGQVTQQTNLSYQDFTLPQQLAQSYAQIATRQPILQATVDSLELGMSWQALKSKVYVAPIPGTQLLAVNVSDSSPERAVVIADELARQLVLQSPTSPENETRQERSQFVNDQLDDLEARIGTARTRMQGLQTELDAALSARQIQELQTEINNLENLVNTWQANYTELLNFLEGGESPNYLTIIEPAQLPTRPIRPDVWMNVLLAAALGLLLAFGAALLLEYLDDTIKSVKDMDQVLGLTVLGSIRRMKGSTLEDKLITSYDTLSPKAEAYRLVRANLQFLAVEQPAKSILITSPTHSEGKSTTVGNLGVIMAQAGLKTIIVDADFRRPSLHKMFKFRNTVGLTDFLRSTEPNIERALVETEVRNLLLLTTGPIPPNPAEILGSPRMKQVLQQLAGIADVIIFDSPPLLAVTDSTVLAAQVDGVILIVEANRTRRDTAKEAIKRLNQIGANVLGGILNNVASGAPNYEYYYTYGYSNRNAARKQTHPTARRWWKRLFALK